MLGARPWCPLTGILLQAWRARSRIKSFAVAVAFEHIFNAIVPTTRLCCFMRGDPRDIIIAATPSTTILQEPPDGVSLCHFPTAEANSSCTGCEPTNSLLDPSAQPPNASYISHMPRPHLGRLSLLVPVIVTRGLTGYALWVLILPSSYLLPPPRYESPPKNLPSPPPRPPRPLYPPLPLPPIPTSRS